LDFVFEKRPIGYKITRPGLDKQLFLSEKELVKSCMEKRKNAAKLVFNKDLLYQILDKIAYYLQF